MNARFGRHWAQIGQLLLTERLLCRLAGSHSPTKTGDLQLLRKHITAGTHLALSCSVMQETAVAEPLSYVVYINRLKSIATVHTTSCVVYETRLHERVIMTYWNQQCYPSLANAWEYAHTMQGRRVVTCPLCVGQ